jgi:hypothetical protein
VTIELTQTTRSIFLLLNGRLHFAVRNNPEGLATIQRKVTQYLEEGALNGQNSKSVGGA